jgi:hypothetical protein
MMKVEELKALPVRCVWEGCHQNFRGDMPKGWRWLLTYWAPEPQLAVDASPDIEWDCDAALCPTHIQKLNSQLATAILSRIPEMKPRM